MMASESFVAIIGIYTAQGAEAFKKLSLNKINEVFVSSCDDPDIAFKLHTTEETHEQVLFP